jgi:formylglycine-generating enzyme required for sulfatase activity/energy-coupling factor transporter ATP-binding protein EcfA2
MAEIEQLKKELEEIKQELATLKEGSRVYKALLDEKFAIEAELQGAGAIAQGDGATAIGQDGIGVGRDFSGNLLKGDRNIVNSTVIVARDGAQIVIGEQPVEMQAKLRETALGRYLEHIIAHNRYLQLQGIRSGGKLVNIELEQIYITLRTTQQRTIQAEEEWLRHEAEFAPGEMRKGMGERMTTETVNVKVEQALAAHKHIVVLGDPGSGKTTLLRYLALLYGRDLAEGTKIVNEKLSAGNASSVTHEESGSLPILLPLRQMGQFLKAHRPKDDGTEGCALLLDFLHQALKNQNLDLPGAFFEEYLEKGRAVVLLDGMDEVADPDLRARVARLVEAFTLAYPKCRFVVTSRVVGYTGSARLGVDYVTTTVRDFTLEDVRQFLKHWHRLVAIGQLGAGESAENFAANQTAQLMNAIEANERVRELAINPLMLTVIALVHRDRVKLPDRRAELYAETVDVLLGKWDEARGVGEIAIFEDRPFDAGDKRLVLQELALKMQENGQKDISADSLRRFLIDRFKPMLGDKPGVRRAVDRFLTVVEERTGLLAARGEGVYAFSHLTFQEYLAALQVAARDDYVEFILAHSGEAWWREAILLTAGYLSTISKERTTKLVRAIAESKKEPALYHNLVLAAECIRDVGINRVDAATDELVKRELRKALDTPIRGLNIFERTVLRKTRPDWIERRAQAIDALVRAGAGYWYPPYGEPEWISIPAGDFWMGDGREQHKLYLPEYQIARVPVTNAQYALFVKAAGYEAPSGWEEGRPPKGKESHPVVNVSWFDAITYCEWLSKMTGKPVGLPSEAEWEKAARGDKDKRIYPWGDKFDYLKCNSRELGQEDTTPVGIFLEGVSPYGVLDMSGNVWEWTRTIWDDKFKYPYKSDDGRENIEIPANRYLRGGSFGSGSGIVRCAARSGNLPGYWNWDLGFRVGLFFSSR